MSLGTAGYGKTPLLPSSLCSPTEGRSGFTLGGLCSNNSGCQQWLFQRSVLQQLCSLAWLSHVPMSPCHAASGG